MYEHLNSVTKTIFLLDVQKGWQLGQSHHPLFLPIDQKYCCGDMVEHFKILF